MCAEQSLARWVFCLALWATPVLAQTAAFPVPSSSARQIGAEHISSGMGAAGEKLVVTVTDENGVDVGSARVQLQGPSPGVLLRCETDFAGHCGFSNLSSGAYELRVEKNGFYALIHPDVHVPSTTNVDVTLSRLQEAREVVNVEESPPAIDPAQIAAQDELSGEEMLNVPYPGANDYRNTRRATKETCCSGF